MELMEGARNRAVAPWLVLDGYHFTSDYQRAIRDSGLRLLIIDDYNHQPRYHADLLLNQNASAECFQYSCDTDTALLLGTKYVLLRKEFLARGDRAREVPTVARKVLITLGGAVPENAMIKVIHALKLVKVKGLEAKIVVGPASPRLDRLEEEIQKNQAEIANFQIVRKADMPGLMGWADAAVSAGGSTCWELAFLNVPFLIIVLAANQKANAEGLEKAGAAINLGWHTEVNAQMIASTLETFLSDRERRLTLAIEGRRILDGRGVERVLERLTPTHLTIRPAHTQDCEQVWKLANDPIIREASFNSGPIPWEMHKRWFRAKIADPACLYYIATVRKGVWIGQVRFDLEGARAVVSVSLVSEYRGFGWGSRLIKQVSEKVTAEQGLAAIEAWIKADNTGSIRAFEKAGYKKVEETEREGCTAVLMRYA
jgi:UDP-2,4-diacetamido-2,4,6-trideoxy-beta-L-altropyranose hydrolase